jgi:eukaryotic-like serine/threonine-protein kinase
MQAMTDESTDLLAIVETLKTGLMSRATGGSFDSQEYRRGRRIVLSLPSLLEVAPTFLKKCRDIDDFWLFIQPKFKTYKERRSYILEEFQPLLDLVEIGTYITGVELEIGDLIGRGGFGEVYKTHHRLLDLDFAIKLFAPIYSDRTDGNLERFFREAKILFALNHRNIIRVFDVGILQGRPFIRMELFDGITLSALLYDRGRVDVRSARRIVISILDGLSHAHTLGVIHRDLKPSNVMIAKPGRLKILDFGLGVFVEDDIVSRITKTGEAVVGGYYTDPELLANPRLLDPRVDLYSVGAIWFDLLTGRAPSGIDVSERLDAEVNLSVPERAALLKCFRAIPRRHKSADTLLQLLRDIGD